MIYRIQESIFFRNDDGRVWTDDDTRVILTATTGRLLAYLLQHKGNVISKDELLENVWDAYGLSTSSNSLYKYISDLRAVFKKLGCTDEIIVTVPKLGFMIAKSVRVERLDDGEPAGGTIIESVIEPLVELNTRPASEPDRARSVNNNSAEDAAVESEINESHSTESQFLENTHRENTVAEKVRAEESILVKPSFMQVKVVLLSIVLTVLVAGIVALYVMGDSGRQEEMTWSLGNIDNCPVRSFNPHESEKSLAVLQNVIATKGMLCSGNSIFFVRVSEPVLTDKKGRIFISRCNYVDDKRKKFSSCENYYRADYEITR
ncbi:helix-turn-helix domain-containing protein [Erwinia sp. S38]|uniref:winged helix-turn-helix domain-containing protein n=1 Tax=Erwinia sp. S38 TaxID=2769338 RepID=UPI00190CE990|nr:helix-turn-helix domain-containing protein [Erwinia sp. S38]MBK0000353.1 helix-turn-helix domain-containing protein [Erwinia sp. S38]